MSGAVIDQITEYALEELLSGTESRQRTLVCNLCQKWPSEPALSIVFALANSASMIEDNLSKSSRHDELRLLAYKLVALLAADIYAADAMGHQPVLAKDVLHFWRRLDLDYLTS